MKKLFIILPALLQSSLALAAQNDRWYSEQQVTQGEQIFKQNCAACHGPNAASIKNWRQTDKNGNYPPPPLNGTAHAWHHSMDVLRKTIREGGQKLGGVMPPFENRLSTEQIDSAISYFQSKWTDDIYDKWAGRFVEKQAKQSLPSISDIMDAQKQKVTQLLSQRTGLKNIPVEKTELKGVWQAQLGDKFVYLMNEGKHAVIGDFFNLEQGKNVTESFRRTLAVKTINSLKDKDLIVYEPTVAAKTILNIFTDTSCPYCRKLHKELPKLLDAGIKVRYIPFPRGGKRGPGYQTLRQVWCSKDRNAAMHEAKSDNEFNLPAGDCKAADMVDKGYQVGNQIGVTGTPALFTASGKKLEGYVPYKQLIPMVLNEQ